MNCWLIRSWRLLKKLVIAEKLLRDDLLVRKAGARCASAKSCCEMISWRSGMHLGQDFLSGNYPDLPESAAGDAFSAGKLS